MLDAESRLIKQHLKAAFPDLTDDLLNKLSNTVQTKTYPRDTILCIEGQHENTFYIILDGQVSFSKKMGVADHFLRYGRTGEFFGEMALLDEKSGRSATVKTTQATQVLEIEREVFENLVRKRRLSSYRWPKPSFSECAKTTPKPLLNCKPKNKPSKPPTLIYKLYTASAKFS